MPRTLPKTLPPSPVFFWMNQEMPKARIIRKKREESMRREVPIGSASGKTGIEAGCVSKKSGVAVARVEKVAGPEDKKSSPVKATGCAKTLEAARIKIISANLTV